MIHRYVTIAVLLFTLVFSSPISLVMATSIDRMSMTNLEGYRGKTINQEITLEGTSDEERSGFWYTHYKETEGDDDKMDITNWITIEPEKYTIKAGEVKVFTVKIKIPRDAEPGLYGATSKEAGREGYSSERRTYVIFKDALGDGNVYSGLLIPLSINVLESKNLLDTVSNFIIQNIVAVSFFVVIVIMAILLLKKRGRPRRQRRPYTLHN